MHPDHDPDAHEAGHDCLACLDEALFREKLAEWRRTGSTPGYIGPRAGKDKQ